MLNNNLVSINIISQQITESVFIFVIDAIIERQEFVVVIFQHIYQRHLDWDMTMYDSLSANFVFIDFKVSIHPFGSAAQRQNALLPPRRGRQNRP